MSIKGTEAFVKVLKNEGVDIVFGYPGGNAIDIFDALYDEKDIDVVLPRHEQGLIHAADGYARSTGKTGVCLVTSGPGATNLVTGISTANYDSVPLVCFTGQVPTKLIGNDAFQEVDIVGITRTICKHCVTVRKREDLVRIIREAFYIARTGKPGPVLIDLPKDIMVEEYDKDDFTSQISIRGYKPNETVHEGQIKRAMEILEKAKKPVFLIGGGVKISGAKKELTELAHITQVPVITTVMGRGAIDTDDEMYVGNIGLHGSFASNRAIQRCDVLFSIGTRFNDRITGKVEEFAKNATIIHIDIEAASISRNISVDVPIVADAKLAIKEMLKRAKKCDTKLWREEIKTWDEEHPMHIDKPKGMSPEKIIDIISDRYQGGIIVTDVGQHQMWTAQYLKMTKDTQLVMSGGLGTMGFGLPAAVGAKIGNRDRQVICISGDGGAQMNIQELATAMSQETPFIFCIFNNSYLGMVRQMQTVYFDKRYSCTCLRYRKSCDRNCMDAGKKCPPYSPDFVKLAESYGAKGIRVWNEDEIEKAFDEADKNTESPTIIEFIIDPENLVLPMGQGSKPLDNMIMDC